MYRLMARKSFNYRKTFNHMPRKTIRHMLRRTFSHKPRKTFNHTPSQMIRKMIMKATVRTLCNYGHPWVAGTG
jgi:hypothetical protein